jgi:hypothetical protein
MQMSSSEETPLLLNEKQAILLRRLVQQEEAVPADRLDGRTLRVLERNGLISRTGDYVTVTDDGRSYFASSVRRRRRVQTRSVAGSRQARAEAIREGVRLLHQTLSEKMPVRIGDLESTPGEIMEGLRRFADELEQGA